MVILIKALQLILALSLLIFVHELGHFMWARIFRIRVEKFYLFFDIGGKALFRFRKGDTEFGIGWLPLGGYCKIAGMIDESMDLEQMKQDPQPWEFRSHKAWQRLFVMAGGVVNNLIFAVLAYIAIMGIWGQAYISNDGAEIYASEIAEEMGFRTGDRILAFDDYVPENFGMLQADLARRNVQYATILRDGDTLKLYIDHSMIGKVLNTPGLFDIAVPFVIDSLMCEGVNANADLRHGDRVIALGEDPIKYLQDAREVLPKYAGGEVEATVLRGSDTLSRTVAVDTSARIGVYMVMPSVCRKSYNFFQAIPAGAKLAWSTVKGYLSDLKLVAKPDTGAYKSVGSFIAIGQVFPATWDWYAFLNILALLSIMLGVMNLIPIPGLDGGHMVFTIYEMVTGRKPSDKFMSVMQMIGMVLILLLMMLAFGNDISRLIH